MEKKQEKDTFKIFYLKYKRETIFACLGSLRRAKRSTGSSSGIKRCAVFTSNRIRPGFTIEYQ